MSIDPHIRGQLTFRADEPPLWLLSRRRRPSRLRSMDGANDHVLFEETQHLARWIRALVLLPVAAVGGLGLALATQGSTRDAAVAGGLALLFALLAVPNFVIRLVTKVDARHLRLRLDPLGLPVPFLPPRDREIPLSDISRCEVHMYRALSDRAYWGNHFWGLGSAFRGGADLYLMRGRGVQLTLRGGERILLSSGHPEALAGVIARDQ